MQYSSGVRATHAAPEPAAAGSLVIFPRSLVAVFASVPDPRRRQGRRFALGADPAAGCVHALVAFSPEQGLVLAQVPIQPGNDKAEAELSVVSALVERLDWQGRVCTGDALFCQRHLCRQIVAAGGDYLLLVKPNQPTLYADLRMLFDPPIPTLSLLDGREARTVDRGHGRCNEVRHLVASTDLVGYSDWPALAQAFRLQRSWQEGGERHQRSPTLAGCGNSSGDIGRSRTAGTTSRTSPWARAAASSTRAQTLPLWPPCATWW